VSISLRPFAERDLVPAREIFRQAFASFLQIPEASVPDGDMVGFRSRAYPEAAFAAEHQGQLVAAAFVTRRGSQFVPGPVIVRPRGWTGNAGQLLMEAVLQRGEREWQCRQAVGYTFANSPRHVEFYRKLGLYPRFLTATLALPIRPVDPPETPLTFASLSPAQRADALKACAALTGSFFEGFEWNNEIEAVQAQEAGDTLLIFEGSRLDGMAICHAGARSEAPTGGGILKFMAVRAGAGKRQTLERLIRQCRSWAAGRGLKGLSVGVNLACKEAYLHLLELGFFTQLFGIALHRPDLPAHLVQDAYVFDDGR